MKIKFPQILAIIFFIMTSSVYANEEFVDIREKTTADFGLDGKVKEYINFKCMVINQEQVEVKELWVYKFNENGVLIREEKMKPDQTPISYIDYVFENNRLSEIKAMDVIRGSEKLDSLKTLKYNDEKNSKTVTSYDWDNSLLRTEKFYYNSNNLLTRYGYIEPNKNILKDFQYNYDESGNLLSKEIKWKTASLLKTTNQYNSEGLLIEQINFEKGFRNTDFAKRDRTTFDYNGDGKLNQSITYKYDYDGLNEEINFTLTYQYKENGDTGIVKHCLVKNYKTGDKLLPKEFQVIKFTDGKKTHITVDDKNNLIEAVEYTYDNDNLIGQFNLDAQSNKLDGESWKYDENGNIIENLIYDKKHILEYKHEYKYDNKNNVIIHKKYSCTEIFDEIEEEVREYSKMAISYYDL